MSPAENKAVFPSYASQDAEAARRIAEALRAAGVEVWFDQNELVGGDAWDAKIRGQIAGCALFVPIISANTQARTEGYFRLEWKLAAQRTHMIADDAAFLLPVVIDDTRDGDARVPAEFKAVQWTRLRPAGFGGQARLSDGGQAPDDASLAAFCARVGKLLGSCAVLQPALTTPEPGLKRRATPEARRRVPVVAWVGAIVAAAAVAGFLVLRPKPETRAEARPPAAETAASAVGENAVANDKSALADKSLVVLPLENLSPDPENAFFTDGMHAEIIATLQAVPELKVLSREAALALKRESGSVAEAGRRAGVVHVLSGSVRREGTKVRVLLDLRRVGDDALLWSAPKVTRELKEALALQAEVAEEVARVLRARFDKGTFAGLRYLAADPRAYDAYLKAYPQYRQSVNSPAGILKAVALMEEGMKIDPKFMPGARLLGRMYVRLYLIEADVAQRERHADAAKTWSELASNLVPGGAGDSSLAFYYNSVGEDPVRSRVYAENTVRALPNDFEGHHYVGQALRGLGRAAEALSHYEHSIALDPVNSPSWGPLMESLASLRRPEAFTAWLAKNRATFPEAQQQADFSVQLFAVDGSLPAVIEARGPSRTRMQLLWRSRRFEELVQLTAPFLRSDAAINQNTFVRLAWLCDASRWLGREAEAMTAARALEKIVQEMNATRERDQTAAPRRVAAAAARLGKYDEAIAAARRAIAACEGPGVYRRWYQEQLLAEIYAYAGRAQECAEVLAKLLAVPSGVTVPLLKADPAWDKVREAPAFQALLADPKNSAPL